jgi:hypothetical protein
MRGRSNVGLVLLAGMAVLLLAWVAPALATEDPPVSVSPSPLSLKVTLDDLRDSHTTGGEASGTVMVAETTQTAGVDITAYYADGSRLTLTSGSHVDFGQARAVPVTVSFQWQKHDFTRGWLEFSDGVDPALTVPFEIHVATPASVLIIASALAGAIAAVIVAFIGWRVRKMRRAEAEAENPASPKAAPVVADGPIWTFQGSWATNLTAVGATLGLVLGASGFLSEVLPGVDLGVFMGFNLLYAALIAVAAVVYQAFYTKGSMPSYRGLVVAGWVTLWAALGELLTVLVLLQRGVVPADWAPAVVFLAAAVALPLLGFYTLASFRAATKELDDEAAETAALEAAALVAARGAWSGQNAQQVRAQARAAAVDVIAVSKARTERTSREPILL